MIVISWHRPTVFSAVSRVSARQIAVIGLVRLRIQRVGAPVGHVGGDVEEDRDVAQRAQHAARPDGVAHRLPHAEPLGDLEVVAHRREPAGGDVDHHEVGAVERGPPVGGRPRPETDAANGRQVLGQLDHPREGHRIDVVEHDLRVAAAPGC